MTRKLVSKPSPSPNLDGRPLLYPHYPENHKIGVLIGAFVLMMSAIGAPPVELSVLPLQTVVQGQASSVQDRKVST